MIQTAGLGPVEATQRIEPGSSDRPGPTFHGFRVVTIKNNTIAGIHLVPMSELTFGRPDDAAPRHNPLPT